MKHKRDEENVLKHFGELLAHFIGKFGTVIGEQFFEATMQYILYGVKLDKKKFDRAIQNLPNNLKVKTMEFKSVAQQYFEEGESKLANKAIIRAYTITKLQIHQIAEVLDISIKRVKAVLEKEGLI